MTADFSITACIEAVKEDLEWRKCTTQELREHYNKCHEEQGVLWNQNMFKALDIVEEELKERNNMTNSTVNTFELNNTTYTTNNGTHCYKWPTGLKGQRIRIKKAEFDAAYEEYINEATREAEEAMATEAALEAVAEAEAQEKPKKKAKKRTPKNVGHRKTYGDVEVILTEKQVDFIHHLPDTCYWEHGLDSQVWVDVLCDEIGGQFANKPMTVGAMISTICEKGLGVRGKHKVNGKKCTGFGLTELGKMVAKDLGL